VARNPVLQYRVRHEAAAGAGGKGADLSPPPVHQPPSISLYLQVFRALLAAVWHDVERHLGTLAQVAQASLLDGRDMDEHVLGATVRLDEPVTLGRVKPLHGSCRHVRTPF
jgi:hypothetical protein